MASPRHSVARRRASAPHPIDRMVAACAVGGLIAALAAIDLGGYWLRRSEAAAKAPASVTLGGRDLKLPGPWIIESRADGSRIDLAIPFARSAANPEHRLNVTAVPSETAARPGAQLQHARFLGAVARSHPSGLVRRPFRDGTPFEGEDFYLAPDGTSFSARCSRTGDDASCLAEMTMDGIDLRVRFPEPRLEEWQAILATLRRVTGSAP